MKNRRKRRKKRQMPNLSMPPSQGYVENVPQPEMLVINESGIPLKKRIQTLSREEDFLNTYILSSDIPRDMRLATSANISANSIRERACFFIDEWGTDWEKIESHYREKHAKYEQKAFDYKCAEIYNNFSYQKMGRITLYKAPHPYEKEEKKPSLFILDGQHRSLSLACRLLEKKIEWQPISYWLIYIHENVKITTGDPTQ